MLINGKQHQSIWYDPQKQVVLAIDQRLIPFKYQLFELKTVDDAWFAIKEMVVRGAPLIGVTGAYGLFLAIREHGLHQILKWAEYLKSCRPTAVNLQKVIDQMVEHLMDYEGQDIAAEALHWVLMLEANEIESCRKIGLHGLLLIEEISHKKNGDTVNILTHCNAGWLACVDWGTVTAPIYLAHQRGIKVHVWVDETRPRNQGARLTAYEMEHLGIPHTVIADNTGGHLMQQGMVDMVITGSDRTARNGDVANKIGTYLKALAAHDNHIPFYVAMPSSSIDFNLESGIGKIEIEQRSGDELRMVEGMIDGEIKTMHVIPNQTPVANFGFDITPARLITGLITERGWCEANSQGLASLFPEMMTAL
jgi:methylthioribose-1-phosphate isomerase